MMSVEIFDALRDADRWREVLQQLPEGVRDVYFLPEYVALHRFIPGTQALLFVFRQGGNLWVYPFLLQPIKQVGKVYLEDGWFDIETAYGYGGVLSNTTDNTFVSEAHSAFSEWCQNRNVVAEFLRLHPLIDIRTWLDPKMECFFDRSTVSIDLSKWGDNDFPFDKESRYMVRRAERQGIHVSIYSMHEYFERFVKMYISTMDRLHAESYYFFNEEYFKGLSLLVDSCGWMVAAELSGKWIAAALFIKGTSCLHYHLSASDPAQRLPGVGNLIVAQGVQIGRQHGLARLHLGGGRTRKSDDKLLMFKQSMSTDTHKFFIGKRIHNVSRHLHLCQLWAEQFPALVAEYGDRLLCYRYGLPTL